MKERGILKFKSDYSKGAMHYITYQDKLVTLTLNDSRKVKQVKDTSMLGIAKNLVSRTFNEMNVTIQDNQEYVRDVFNFMLNEKHTHYKKWDDRLVVLQLSS